MSTEKVPLAEVLEDQRGLRDKRKAYYEGKVTAGEMEQAEATRKIAMLDANVSLLEFVVAREVAFRKWCARMIEGERAPLLKEVQERFPGAQLEDVEGGGDE